MNTEAQQLYDAALAADRAFQEALETQYGEAAGDMRYRTQELPPRIRKLAKAHQVASGKLHDYHAGARGERSNPRGFAQAVRLYEGFHGVTPQFVEEVELNLAPVALLVGKVAAIEYDTPYQPDDRFRHEFSGKAMPTLAVTSDGEQLLILEGEYFFNDHGIVDGEPPEA